MQETPSRRQTLRAIGATTVAAIAGCSRPTARADPPDPTARTLERSQDWNDPTTQTIPDGVVQFRRSLERWGYYPDESVPDEVEIDWRLDDINVRDHSAAKASAVPLPNGDVVFPGDTGVLTAVSSDGEVRWRAETEDLHGRGVHGTPAVADGRLYVGDYEGILYAFDPEDGDELWRVDLGGSIGSSPLYHDGYLYVSVEYPDPEGSMFAVDAETGAVAWEDPEHRPTDHPHSSPAIDLATGRMVVGSNDGILYCWEYPSLDFSWSFETHPDRSDSDNDTRGQIKGPIATYDGGAYFGSWDQHIYRVDLEGGTEDWSFKTGWVSMAGVGIDPSTATVYAGSNDANLYALDAHTGEERWRFDAGLRISGCPTICAERVLVGSNSATLFAIDKESGEEVWSVEHGGNVSSAPRIIDGDVYYAERAPDPENGETDGGAYKLVAVE